MTDYRALALSTRANLYLVNNCAECQTAENVAYLTQRCSSSACWVVPEAFLSGCIPQLKLDTEARLYFNKSCKEINTNSRFTSLVKLALCEVLQKWGLSHSTVAKQDHSKLVVENRLHHPVPVHAIYYKHKHRKSGYFSSWYYSPQGVWCKLQQLTAIKSHLGLTGAMSLKLPLSEIKVQWYLDQQTWSSKFSSDYVTRFCSLLISAY